VLWLTGKPRYNLDRTFDILCFSSSTAILAVIPIFGWVIAWIWPAVTAAIMISETQGVSMPRAVAAALLPPVLLLIFMLLPAVL
jgi:hypothetical protein